MSRLDDDIKFHEPKLALSGGSDGFRDLRKVILKSKKLLKINGKLILEIGHNQRNQCAKILNENKFYINKISKDLSGADRCIVSTKLQQWTISKIIIEEVDLSQMVIEALEEMEMDTNQMVILVTVPLLEEGIQEKIIKMLQNL